MSSHRETRTHERGHGHSCKGRRTPEYRAWSHMIGRCYSTNDRGYPNYGGRGVTVCDLWRSSSAAFLADMGERPSAGHSIDRFPDNNGGYWCGHCEECVRMGRKLNCRWATRVEQQNNTTRNRFLTARGKTQTASQWSQDVGLTPHTILLRIDRYGWTVEEALFTPANGHCRFLTARGRTQTMGQWSAETGISLKTISTRLDRDGLSHEEALFKPIRQAGAKMTATSAVNVAVKDGRLPPVKTLSCQRCGQQAKFYHHHLGKDRAHFLDVTPLCGRCFFRAFHAQDV